MRTNIAVCEPQEADVDTEHLKNVLKMARSYLPTTLASAVVVGLVWPL